MNRYYGFRFVSYHFLMLIVINQHSNNPLARSMSCKMFRSYPRQGHKIRKKWWISYLSRLCVYHGSLVDTCAFRLHVSSIERRYAWSLDGYCIHRFLLRLGYSLLKAPSSQVRGRFFQAQVLT